MDLDGIEPLAATPLNNGHRVTAGDGEQDPNRSHTLLNVSYKTNCNAMRPLLIRSQAEPICFIRYHFTH